MSDSGEIHCIILTLMCSISNLQVEFHPHLFQRDLLDFCRANGILLQAYTSLGQGKVIIQVHVLVYLLCSILIIHVFVIIIYSNNVLPN